MKGRKRAMLMFIERSIIILTRLLSAVILASVSVCPTSFTCALNCRLGYRTDSNGCLLCECQSCPAMDQCQKNCPSGYLKDLFDCDICECKDPCPTFSCDIVCPLDVGYAKSSNGCPLCQCATARTKVAEKTSSCQVVLWATKEALLLLSLVLN